LVIGTHGYGALEKLLGTTASRLVERASCDVYVVRAR
jgi:nucleotide-binding universal stress UspA family protein